MLGELAGGATLRDQKLRHRHGASYQSTTPAIKTSFCVAAAAATPTVKLAVEKKCRRRPRAPLLSTTGAANEVALWVQAKATHPTSYLSDQIRPVRSSTTRTIRMIPMTPTPP